jgi:hypothetical protein
MLYPDDETRAGPCRRGRDHAALLAALEATGVSFAMNAQRADAPFSDALAKAIQLYLARSTRHLSCCRWRT